MSDEERMQGMVKYKERISYESLIMELLRDLARLLGNVGKYTDDVDVGLACERAMVLYNTLVPELRRELDDVMRDVDRAETRGETYRALLKFYRAVIDVLHKHDMLLREREFYVGEG